MKNKKIIIYICIGLVVVVLFSFCFMSSSKADPIRGKLEMTGEDAGGTIVVNNPEYDDGWFDDNSDVFNQKMALFSEILSTDNNRTVTSKWNNEEVKKGSTGDGDGKKMLLSKLGFDDVKSVDITSDGYSTDKKDTTSFQAGMRKVDDKVIFVFNFKGTAGDEWDSNFDIGCDCDEYYNTPKGKEHPDWLNKKNHKGFDVASVRACKEVQKYIMQSCDYLKDKMYILFSGHSRGGAVANIIGARFEKMIDYDNGNSKDEDTNTFFAKIKESDDSKLVTRTYTFASPNTVFDSEDSAKEYKTIYNIINNDDIVPCMPLSKWGATRYGQSVYVNLGSDENGDASADDESIAKNESETMKKLIKQCKGADYECCEYDDIIEILAKGAKDRKDIYVSHNGHCMYNAFDGMEKIATVISRGEKASAKEVLGLVKEVTSLCGITGVAGLAKNIIQEKVITHKNVLSHPHQLVSYYAITNTTDFANCGVKMKPDNEESNQDDDGLWDKILNFFHLGD